MDERSRTEAEQPLFLDESPDMPRYSKPSGVPIEELFRDEPVLAPSYPAPSFDPGSGTVTVTATAPRAARHLRVTATTYVMLFFAALLLAFAVVTVWLR